MRKIKVLIVEDEMIVARDISHYLEELGCEVCDVLMDGEAVLPYIKHTQPDIILMDIMLKGAQDGIATVKLINESYSIPIVFLTANTDDLTFEMAKSTQPFAFIEKPFKRKTLVRTIQLMIERLLVAEDVQATEPVLLNDRIFVRDQNKMQMLKLEDILYLEAERAYCKIVTSQKSYLLSTALSSIESRLPSAYLMRVHRSYMINLRMIESIVDGGVIINKTFIPVSRSNWKHFISQMNVI